MKWLFHYFEHRANSSDGHSLVIFILNYLFSNTFNLSEWLSMIKRNRYFHESLQSLNFHESIWKIYFFSMKSNSFCRFTLRKSFFKNLKLEPPNKISTYRNSSRFTAQMTRIIPTHKLSSHFACNVYIVKADMLVPLIIAEILEYLFFLPREQIHQKSFGML